MDNSDSLVQIGKLSGQYEAMSGRLKSLEGRVETSDRLIIEKIESLQEDVQEAVVELHKHSSVLDIHKRAIIAILAVLGSSGLIGASTAKILGVF